MTYGSYELHPWHISQKSFYGKAQVTTTKDGDDMYHVLRSYGTFVVSVYVCSGGTPYVKKLWNGYSATTMRHINELLMQQGFPKLSARVWRAMEVGEFYHADEIPALDIFTR